MEEGQSGADHDEGGPACQEQDIPASIDEKFRYAGTGEPQPEDGDGHPLKGESQIHVEQK